MHDPGLKECGSGILLQESQRFLQRLAMSHQRKVRYSIVLMAASLVVVVVVERWRSDGGEEALLYSTTKDNTS